MLKQIVDMELMLDKEIEHVSREARDTFAPRQKYPTTSMVIDKGAVAAKPAMASFKSLRNERSGSEVVLTPRICHDLRTSYPHPNAGSAYKVMI